ncbi:MAG: hypothetical protein ACPG6B_04945 [Oceanihabitans sp.]
MKTKLIGLLVLIITITSNAQNYQTVEEVDDVCAQLGFSANEDAEIAVESILEQVGILKRIFELRSCPNINNAAAINITDEKGDTQKYILYDLAFMKRISDQADSDWAAKSVLAHEIGHHIFDHSLNNKGSNHKWELEADYWSGWAMGKLGASLTQAQSAIQSLRYEKATRTHPAKADRLAEIEKGWIVGSQKSVISNDDDIIDENKLKEYHLKGINASNDNNYSDALYWYRKAADRGYSKSQHSIGYIYENGLGSIAEDDKIAFSWFEKAANQDNAASQNYLAYMYRYGYGTAKDNLSALYWYGKAARAGYPNAQHSLGTMYQKAEGVPRDDKKAVSWFLKAAEQGYDASQNYLGYMYKEGLGVNKDLKKSFNWYLKAAEQGYMQAQHQVGVAYDRGEGVIENNTTAVEWFRRAAEKGNDSSQNYLAHMYRYGYGVEKDYPTAVYWYRKAARQGYELSQKNLRELNETW